MTLLLLWLILLLVLAILVLLFWLAAAILRPPQPAKPVSSHFVLAQGGIPMASITLIPGATQGARDVFNDAAGNEVPAPGPIDLASTDDSVATITADDPTNPQHVLFTAVAAGTATLTATSLGIVSSQDVIVSDPATSSHFVLDGQ
jgi:hypothetical protein